MRVFSKSVISSGILSIRNFSHRKLWHPIAGKSPKWMSAQEAVSTIQSDTDIYVHAHASTPTELLQALCDRVIEKDLNQIRPNHIILQGDIPWVQEKYWGRVRSNCLFICGNLRKLVNAGHADYVPVFLSDIPRLYENGTIPVDVALITVSPPDSRGFCTLGVDVDCSSAAVGRAKHIIALVNPTMPHTYGEGLIHSSHIDTFVSTERQIYALPKVAKPSEQFHAGIGAIPDSTLLAMGQHKDLGIHTELISDGVVPLIESGVVNNQKKTVYPGKVVSSFAFGTRNFYDLMDHNPMFHFASCGWTNHIDVVRENSRMTCINSALEIDLTGQVVSDSIGTSFYSGFGGQVDFIFGSSVAKDGLGKAIIALPSRTSKGKSKIVPTLQPGAGVVTTRGHVRFIVTEYGIADLWGKNVRQRAEALIGIAHPDDRDQLTEAARKRLKC